MSEPLRWLPPEVWTALKAGADCPMCADIHLDENPFSSMVGDLRQSYGRLCQNQSRRGWRVVAPKRQASELFDLSEAELAGFWLAVAHMARALDAIYRPAKVSENIGQLVTQCRAPLVMTPNSRRETANLMGQRRFEPGRMPGVSEYLTDILAPVSRAHLSKWQARGGHGGTAPTNARQPATCACRLL